MAWYAELDGYDAVVKYFMSNKGVIMIVSGLEFCHCYMFLSG